MEKADTTISLLTPDDLAAVDELMMRHTGTLGFLPREALDHYLRNNGVLGARAEDGRLAGYLLYAANPDRFRITQLCVSDDHRGKGAARRLVQALKSSATTQKLMTLRCRNDFPAHGMWPKLGFVAVSDARGRSIEGYPLTLWHLVLSRDNQLALFHATVSDSALDVVIDAQVFFDLGEPVTDETKPSHALVSDPFVHSVNLWYTDELFNEISRNPDARESAEARNRTVNFPKLEYDPLTVEINAERLREFLPSERESQKSDIRHLAKAAASEVRVFVTRDQGLLKKAADIAAAVNVEVMSPVALVVKLREYADGDAAQPEYVSGLQLRWSRLESDRFEIFPFNLFLDRRERLSRLKRRISSLLADPARELEVLWSGTEPVAIRILEYGSRGLLTISLGRVRASREGTSPGRFLIAEVLRKAVREEQEAVSFDVSDLSPGLLHGLSEMGFRKRNAGFARFCFTRHVGREAVMTRIAELSAESADGYADMSSSDLEKSTSPAVVVPEQNHFLIPIKPGYALNLFDRRQSAYDMFGGDPDRLLRWSNVYYMKARYRKMLQCPARILWYVSGLGHKKLVAVSRLDDVVIDTPRELLRQFSKYGTLEWRELYRMCEGDESKNLMALLFSHTFPFREEIPLSEVWRVFDEDCVGRSVQSARSIPQSTFRKLFELGFQEQS